MPRTIWIIDDDFVSQFATRYCLEQYEEKFKIETFESAEEGLAELSNLKIQKKAFPSIIFLDLIMENMNGWEFIESFQLLAKGKRLPEIYILSAFSRSKDREIAKKHKVVSGYYDKPLTKVGLNKVFEKNVRTNS
ncbi:hypothetical protein HME9304_01782 [Flagellimonas maritima]|uniref:Response regulatory domain-containing protein n=1 Tax=Flagellimonas maritima TaxID=1383885 RepID=A0A2Z4LTT2_9FLAO|nr:response regulator [Allomuricauda aurantiaca]AWX44778.1 hypothetical protein HME9304_01782 [Allomuricauda aurantiaca]